MADLTHGAVDSLLGILAGAIKDEAQLLSGVQRDIQFIRDEMDSMNGFLLHLTKSGDDHDDQQRAWMKQVRDIAYIAQDCIELYRRDPAPPDKGIWARMCHVPVLLKTWWLRRCLANRLRDLKVRVRDVGERRQRYGVTVPEAKKGNINKNGGKGVDEAREAFRTDLARARSEGSFRNAIVTMLAECYLKPAAETPSSSLDEVERLIQNAIPEGDENAIICMEMLLCALQVAPRGQGRVSKQELHDLIISPSSSSSDLKTASDDSADDLHFRVMVLCYSKLSYDYKSCLQYLTAFLNEKSISRTSLVRRWAAERLVGVAKEDEKQSHEKAAENCFNELLFRGFISPVEHGAAGNKVKSCMMRGQVKEFIEQISKSENFEGSHLPTHLDNHLRIRQMVDAQQKKLEQAQDQHSADAAACPSPNTCGLFSLQIRKQEDKRPIDELLNHLRSLPETYRLNVLDLGGCRGLKERHLKSICDCKTMQTLRYLSLRNTDVSSLPKQIRELWLLETLDIRETKIQASCTESIHLRKLKHLLAGDGSTARRTGEALSTVRMPTNISKMTDMEVLSCVQISGGSELSELENLKKLRKLGVLLPGRQEDINDLRQAIFKMGGGLHSLSIWINTPCADDVSLDKKDGDGTFLRLENLESLSIAGMDKSGLPSLVDEGLNRLSKITLCNTHLTPGKLGTLSKLTGLLCLRLHHGSFVEEELAFRADGFIALKFLLLESAATTKLTFEENASPQLEKIVWSMDAKVAATASAPGIEHLAGLKQVVLKGLREGDSCPLVEKAVAKHPKHRAIEIIGVWKIVAVTSTT